MELLMQKSDLNISDEYNQVNLLTFCYINEKHKAFDLMVQKSDGTLKIN